MGYPFCILTRGRLIIFLAGLQIIEIVKLFHRDILIDGDHFQIDILISI
jgi:hypothetical protein